MKAIKKDDTRLACSSDSVSSVRIKCKNQLSTKSITSEREKAQLCFSLSFRSSHALSLSPSTKIKETDGRIMPSLISLTFIHQSIAQTLTYFWMPYSIICTYLSSERSPNGLRWPLKAWKGPPFAGHRAPFSPQPAAIKQKAPAIMSFYGSSRARIILDHKQIPHPP